MTRIPLPLALTMSRVDEIGIYSPSVAMAKTKRSSAAKTNMDVHRFMVIRRHCTFYRVYGA